MKNELHKGGIFFEGTFFSQNIDLSRYTVSHFRQANPTVFNSGGINNMAGPKQEKLGCHPIYI